MLNIALKYTATETRNVPNILSLPKFFPPRIEAGDQ